MSCGTRWTENHVTHHCGEDGDHAVHTCTGHTARPSVSTTAHVACPATRDDQAEDQAGDQAEDGANA